MFKGKEADVTETAINAGDATNNAWDAFKVGLAIPNGKFWVNLAPDMQDMVVPYPFNKTWAGKVMLQADLDLKYKYAELKDCDHGYGNSADAKSSWKEIQQKWNSEIDDAIDSGKCPSDLNRGKIGWLVVGRVWIEPEYVNVSGDDCKHFVIDSKLDTGIATEPGRSYVEFHDGYTVSSGCEQELDRIVKSNLLPFVVEQDKKLFLSKVKDMINNDDTFRDLRQVYVSLALAQLYKKEWKAAGRPNGWFFADLIKTGDLTDLEYDWNMRDVWNEFKASWDSVVEYGNSTYTCEISSNGKYKEYMTGGVVLDNIPIYYEGYMSSEQENLVTKAIHDGYSQKDKEYYFGHGMGKVSPDIESTILTLNPDVQIKDGKVEIYGVVKNNGAVDAEDIEIIVYALDSSRKRYDIAHQNLPITAGISEELYATWNVTLQGNYKVYLQVDPNNKVLEFNEENNLIVKNLIITIPDIVPIEIILMDPTPIHGDNISVVTKIKNRGFVDMRNVPIFIYIDETLVKETSMWIEKDSVEELKIILDTSNISVGEHNIKVVADSLNEIPEINENNNEMSKTILIA
ncbi:MAG: hypothetical protein CVV39_08985, partial [Planctomycetes bacterium HGW-Planctomycetes-1]